jgi:hypothetical protein
MYNPNIQNDHLFCLFFKYYVHSKPVLSTISSIPFVFYILFGKWWSIKIFNPLHSLYGFTAFAEILKYPATAIIVAFSARSELR